MHGRDKVILDEMDSPWGRLQLVAHREEETGIAWIGVTSGPGPPISALRLRTGSWDRYVIETSIHDEEWAVVFGAVAPEIVRAEIANDEGQTFPARIIELPPAVEQEYRAVWGLGERCTEECHLIVYDRGGAPFGESDPRVTGSAPTDAARLEAIRRHADSGLRYYATAFLRESEEGRQSIAIHLALTANFMALVEAPSVDEEGMLTRREQIVNRYIEEAKRQPWEPPNAPSGS
jgi:hypothetical protein